MEDLALIDKVLKGDEISFEQLFLKYQLEISKFVYSNIKDNEVTKDIVQEVFITVYDKLYTFKRDCKFKTWLYTIARNKCIDYIRKNKITLVDIEDTQNTLASKEISAFEIVEFNETKRTINDFIKTLDTVNREIIYLKYYHDDITFYDISYILKISEGAVKQRYYSLYKRYINFLKKASEKRGENLEV
ncbi:RNA polymerase sigma-70 factor, ECF subfamily [Clostridium cavendishii DSM 21758]|uniref:RNA polymerase sigma-70 factor, ECF subfamily n=1 Tax=Clostridium cavendishii DSM 21758 TaxID=1121302 RepID=A0A1M6JD92_9CLOT|nr:RNA polymerase sigma factor [Clostridium cavendishii]SHJ44590.1 RNA polymerase sigma-70 factor, ECF subfamily [Clostridium cavendishii DSM 21758]